jgi:hypothetical protein
MKKTFFILCFLILLYFYPRNGSLLFFLCLPLLAPYARRFPAFAFRAGRNPAGCKQLSLIKINQNLSYKSEALDHPRASDLKKFLYSAR